MCVIYAVNYFCGHRSFLDQPSTTACDLMASASTSAHPVYCSGETPIWDFYSDNVCRGCSTEMYRTEKRYAITKAVIRGRSRAGTLEQGRMLRPLAPLTPHGTQVWMQWRRDRERFRSISISGGMHGELGQGWLTKKFNTERRPFGYDFYKQYGGPGREWMSERYGPGEMYGFEDDYGFDPFLGPMGELEEPKVRGMLAALREAEIEDIRDSGEKMLRFG